MIKVTLSSGEWATPARSLTLRHDQRPNLHVDILLCRLGDVCAHTFVCYRGDEVVG